MCKKKNSILEDKDKNTIVFKKNLKMYNLMVFMIMYNEILINPKME